MWIAGVTSQRPRITRASAPTTQISEAVSSCHHSPHGFTNMSVCPSGCHVMCPARFSANPIPARWRNATASACSSERSTPIGGTTDGAHTSRPPRRALGVVMVGLRPGFDVLAQCAFGYLAARRSRQLVDHDESLRKQLLENTCREEIVDEAGQGDGLRADEFGIQADLFDEHRIGH